MFNNDIKIRYIEYAKLSNVSIEDVLLRFFSRTEPFEQMFDKDLSNFTTKEIITYYKFINTSSIKNLTQINSLFSNYASWSISEGLVADSQNHFMEINSEVLLTCVNKTLSNMQIITREELLKQLEMLDNPSDQFLILALFEGVYKTSYNEIYYVTKESIKGNELTTYTGRTITVSDELIKYAYNSIDTYEYYCYLEEGSRIVNAVRNFDPSDKKMFKTPMNARANDNDIIIRQRLLSKVRRLQQYTGLLVFKGKALVESGKIHLLKELKAQNPDKEYAEIYYNNKQMFENRYGIISSFKTFYNLYKDFLGE